MSATTELVIQNERSEESEGEEIIILSKGHKSEGSNAITNRSTSIMP